MEYDYSPQSSLYSSGSYHRGRGERARLRRRRRRRRVLALFLLLILAAAVFFCAKVLIRRPELAETSYSQSMGGHKEGVYTILLFGEDTSSQSTDTIMLITADTVNKTCNVVSIPRDSMVNVSWSTKKINSVYMNSGLEGLRQQVKNVTGIQPDYYVKVDWSAIGGLVDAIGGVWYDVPCDMNYDDPAQDLHIHLSAGYQELDGDMAMQLVRWRKNNDGTSASVGDIGRIEIQQSFLMSVVGQTLKLSNVLRLPSLIQVFRSSVESDLSFSNLLWFGLQYFRADLERDLNFTVLPGNIDGSYHKLSYVLLYPDQIVELMNASFNPYRANLIESDLEIIQINSSGDLYVTTGSLAG